MFSCGYAGSLLLHRFFSSCGASQCGGFSCCGAQALGHAGFTSCGTRAQELQLSGSSAGSTAAAQRFLAIGMWGLPGSQIEPCVSCTELFTTEPPGKPRSIFLIHLMLGGRNEAFPVSHTTCKNISQRTSHPMTKGNWGENLEVYLLDLRLWKGP